MLYNIRLSMAIQEPECATCNPNLSKCTYKMNTGFCLFVHFLLLHVIHNKKKAIET